MAAGRARQEAAGNGKGGLAVGGRQEQGELVPADAERAIRDAEGRADQPADGGQELVPGGVPAGVVEPLQVVEVEDDERQRAAGAGRVGDLAGQLLLEGAVVAQAGQRVHARVETRPIVGFEDLVVVGLEGRHRPDDLPDRESCDQRRRSRDERDSDEDRRAADDPDDEEAGGRDGTDAPEPAHEGSTHGVRGPGRAGSRLGGRRERGGLVPRFHGTAIEADHGAGLCHPEVPARNQRPPGSSPPRDGCYRFGLAVALSRSRRIRWAASFPGAPVTQPPGCVPDPHW